MATPPHPTQACFLDHPASVITLRNKVEWLEGRQCRARHTHARERYSLSLRLATHHAGKLVHPVQRRLQRLPSHVVKVCIRGAAQTGIRRCPEVLQAHGATGRSGRCTAQSGTWGEGRRLQLKGASLTRRFQPKRCHPSTNDNAWACDTHQASTGSSTPLPLGPQQDSGPP